MRTPPPSVIRPAALLAIAAASVAGCGATEVARRPRPSAIAGGEQGGSWEAVFPTPSVALAAGAPEQSPEFSRNDDAVSHRPAEPLLASREWPEPARDWLGSPRYLSLPSNPGTVLWFRSGPDSRSRFDRWHGAWRSSW